MFGAGDDGTEEETFGRAFRRGRETRAERELRKSDATDWSIAEAIEAEQEQVPKRSYDFTNVDL